jgi:YHS domain-containing protein
MDMGPNGGTLQTVGTTKIETVIQPKGIMFTILDAHGKPVATPQAKGTLKLKVGDSPKEYTYPLAALKNQAIGIAVDLSKVEGHMLHMNVELTGAGPQPLSFHALGKVGGGDQLSDAVLISLQGVCPVSGQKLGSMGATPKVVVNGKPLFICCAGCKSKVESSPDQYLAKFYGAKGEEVRPGVFKATLADTKAIAAQKVCPVMDEPLGGMGTPLKVDVKGKAVFICCAGCAKKLAAESDKYLQQLAKAGIQPPAMK